MASPKMATKESVATDQVEEQLGSLLSQALVMSGWLQPDEGHSENERPGAPTEGSKPVFQHSPPGHATQP